MPRFGKIAVLFALFALLSPMEARAVETPPPLSAREIIERLTKVKVMEDELARDRESLHSLLEAFRSLGKSDEQLADVLRRFRLL